jgi:hypothetical protein
MVMQSFAIGVMEMSVMWARTIPMLLERVSVSLPAPVLSHYWALSYYLVAANQDQKGTSYKRESLRFSGSQQLFPVTQQLNDGIRLLQLQALNQKGTIRLCHSSCV